MNVNYHILNSTVVVNYDGKLFKIPLDDDLGKKVISLIRDNRLEEIPELVDVAIKLQKITKNKFEIIDGVVYSYGEVVPNVISDKIIKFHENGIPFDNLINFWNNLKINPSIEAVRDLYRFLEVNEFPITPDGYFIAYKRITKDFKDIYTKKIDHSIGSKPKMERNLVCDNNQITCASGLHIASYYYASSIYGNSVNGDILVEVKVHPKDVVSVPFDYNGAKARCCEYEVIRVIKEENTNLVVFGEEYNIKYDTEYNDDTDDDLEEDDTYDEDYNEEYESNSFVQNYTNIKIGNYFFIPKPITKDRYEQLIKTNFRKRKPSDIPNQFFNDEQFSEMKVINVYSSGSKMSYSYYVYLVFFKTENDKDEYVEFVKI